jgi:hypothetical protein
MLNKRIRDQGGKIFLDHTLRVRYPAKSSIQALARQYFIYGGARAHVWLKYRALTSPRQAIPVLFLLWILMMAVLGLWYSSAYLALFAGLSAYAATILAASFVAVLKERRIDLLGRLAVAFTAIHFAWPAGFLLRAVTPSIYFRLLLGSK